MTAWTWIWGALIWGSVAWYAVLVVVLGVLGVRDTLALLAKLRKEAP